MKYLSLLLLLFISSCSTTKQPELRCSQSGLPIESIIIDHLEYGDFQTITTHIECKRFK